MIYKCPVCGRVEIDKYFKDFKYIDNLPEKCVHITDDNRLKVTVNLAVEQQQKFAPIELFKKNLRPRFYLSLLNEAQKWRDVGHYVYLEYEAAIVTRPYVNISFGLFLDDLKHNINFVITPLDVEYSGAAMEDYIHEIFKHQNHRLWDGIRDNFYKVGKS